MAMVLGYAYCNVAVLPVRKEPFHTAEQNTQLLFGERAEILQTNNRDWAQIRCAWDDYIGWCKLSQLAIVQKKEYKKEVKYLAASHNGRLIMPEGELFIPLGSELRGLKGGNIATPYGKGKYKGGKITINKAEATKNAITEFATMYLHAPYQWGGRSAAGIDCSGLVQMVFKLCNHKTQRDAKDQATEGHLVDFLQNAQCGDLAFFEEKEGQINHVGILLDNETIIHATDSAGRVVIDRIDQGGIISVVLKKRTHALRMVRRIV